MSNRRRRTVRDTEWADGCQVIRQELERPDQYMMLVDETMLMWIEDGLRLKLVNLEESVARAKGYEANGLTYAQVAELVNPNGDHIMVSDNKFEADEDLMFLYAEMGRINKVLYQAVQLRNRPNDHTA